VRVVRAVRAVEGMGDRVVQMRTGRKRGIEEMSEQGT
jgi:hypothetical protein